MKLKVTKSEEPKTDDKPKSKKLRVKPGKNIKTQYSTYSGIVNDEGKSVDNPTEVEAVTTMAKYMRKNQSDQSSSPSNVYRTKFSHLGLNYDRKKKEDKA